MVKEALLAGSRAYGTPREDSDIDLVIYCSEEVKKLLLEHSDNEHPRVISFGKLNILACTTNEEYAVWKSGIQTLKEKGPVDRETAKNHFKRLRLEVSESMDMEYPE